MKGSVRLWQFRMTDVNSGPGNARVVFWPGQSSITTAMCSWGSLLFGVKSLKQRQSEGLVTVSVPDQVVKACWFSVLPNMISVVCAARKYYSLPVHTTSFYEDNSHPHGDLESPSDS